MAILLIYALLTLTALTGIFGLFLAKEYVKKISCLSICYISLAVLIILLSQNVVNQSNNLLLLTISLIIIFAANLLIGISIAKRIAGSN